VGLIVSVLVGAVAFMGQAHSRRVVEADEFRVTDGAKILAILGNFDGFPGLTLLDRKGSSRAALLLDRAGHPQLSFSDERRKTRVSLVGGQNGSYLSFRDANEAEKLKVVQNFNGASLVVVRDGEAVASLGSDTDGDKPALWLGRKGEPLFIAALDEQGLPTVQPYEDEDHPRVVLGDNGAGPGLKINYSNGTTAVALGVSAKDRVPFFGLVDERGNVLFHAPE